MEQNLIISVLEQPFQRVSDLQFGSSDLGLYLFCKERKIRLLINNRVHLKAYISDWRECITGSSNVTQRGLGLGTKFNYELNSEHRNLDAGSLLYLRKIVNHSVPVTESLYLIYKEKLDELPPLAEVEEVSLKGQPVAKDNFFISSLPKSKDIKEFYQIYSMGLRCDDEELLSCALHDIALYEIPLGLLEADFINHIRECFFGSGFVVKLLEYIGVDGKYFGRVKEWIQRNCQDVPVSSRDDLTATVQVLYRWIVELSHGEYKVDRPNYSERIYKVRA